MPASQECFECCHCGLSAHHSRLISPGRREALRREHVAALRARARDGAIASRQLAAIHGTFPLLASAAIGAVVLTGLLLAIRLLRRS